MFADYYVEPDENESTRRGLSHSFSSTSFLPPLSKTVPGYTGHQRSGTLPRHVLKTPLTKLKITGYSGHIIGSQNVCGERIIPSDEEQKLRAETKYDTISGNRRVRYRETRESKDEANHYDLQEQYIDAMELLWRRGQTPQMLLRMLQGKVSERVNCFADQLVRVRKLFESFAMDGTDYLDLYGFRKCLELISCQLDDIQSTALFAYFDENNNGRISWELIAAHSMVHNPRSAKIVPKLITATLFNEDWNSMAVANSLYH